MVDGTPTIFKTYRVEITSRHHQVFGLKTESLFKWK